jgi:hypothetical protein
METIYFGGELVAIQNVAEAESTVTRHRKFKDKNHREAVEASV